MTILSAWEIVEGVHSRTLEEDAAARAALERIQMRDPIVRAWTHVVPAGETIHPTERNSRGPLAGVPVGIKDTIDTQDMPTECGTSLYRGRRPAWDAACVAILRAAGAVVVGKTVTAELGYFSPGPTTNPRNAEYSPGGSSSGSAASVADGMVPVALGVQTAGSVIRPASYCGVVGFVGSRGRLPLAGVKTMAPSFDALGVFSRSTRDVILVQRALTQLGRKPTQGTGSRRIEPTAMRVGVWDGAELGADAEMRAALSLAADRIAESAEVERLDLGAVAEPLTSAHEEIMAYEAARSLFHESRFPAELSAPLQDLLQHGREISEAQLIQAMETIRQAREMLGALFQRIEVILAPSATGAAPRGLESTGSPVMSRPWQALGLPAISLPVCDNATGMPLGVQLVGAYNTDLRLIASGSRVERWLRYQRPRNDVVQGRGVGVAGADLEQWNNRIGKHQ